MTLDEAIKHAEEVADGHDRIKQIKTVTLEECKCAEEHRQLAEWLKDYKRLLEQEPILNKIRVEIEKKHARAKQMSSVLQMNAYTDCLQIIDKYMKEGES